MNKKLVITLLVTIVVIPIFFFIIIQIIIFNALNPSDRFQEARNSTRYTDVNTIQTAISSYRVDNYGALPYEFEPNKIYQLGTCTTGGATLCPGAQNKCLDIMNLPGMDRYLAIAPMDQKDGTPETTGYSVMVSSTGKIKVNACIVEGDVEEISTTR